MTDTPATITIPLIKKRLLPWMKSSLFDISVRIRELKSQRKRPDTATKDKPWSGHVAGLDGLRFDARVLNIAYGLVRGHKYDQIEPKRNEDWKKGGVNPAYLAECVNKLLSHETKLYVAINPHLNMTPEQQMVQGAHAVAEFMVDNTPSPWLNGTLIFIDMPSLFGPASGDHEGALDALQTADPTGRWSWFNEPDLGGKVTAVAIWSPNGERELRLDRAPRLKIRPIPSFAGPRSEADAGFERNFPRV